MNPCKKLLLSVLDDIRVNGRLVDVLKAMGVPVKIHEPLEEIQNKKKVLRKNISNKKPNTVSFEGPKDLGHKKNNTKDHPPRYVSLVLLKGLMPMQELVNLADISFDHRIDQKSNNIKNSSLNFSLINFRKNYSFLRVTVTVALSSFISTFQTRVSPHSRSRILTISRGMINLLENP